MSLESGTANATANFLVTFRLELRNERSSIPM
jgi:hypothetical protein